jgi:predicted nucleic acid-binding protein
LTVVYAESSAIVAWLLGEEGSESVRRTLEASQIVTSRLTLLESDRALVRAVVAGRCPSAKLPVARAALAAASPHWGIAEVSAEIVDMARRTTFPREPIRTLDAVHVATLLSLQSLDPPLRVLSLDDRVRDTAALLGFELLPPALQL